MVVLLWVLNAVAGLLFAIRAGLDYRKKRNGLTLCMLLIFLFFCMGSACAGAAFLASSPDQVVAWTWRISFLCLFLLIFPVFIKYLLFYRGAYLEGGIILILLISGMLCQSVLCLALVSMVSVGILYFGCYEWLRHCTDAVKMTE